MQTEGRGKWRNLNDFAGGETWNFANWHAEFGKNFCRKQWALFISQFVGIVVSAVVFMKRFPYRYIACYCFNAYWYSKTVHMSCHR